MTLTESCVILLEELQPQLKPLHDILIKCGYEKESHQRSKIMINYHHPETPGHTIEINSNGYSGGEPRWVHWKHDGKDKKGKTNFRMRQSSQEVVAQHSDNSVLANNGYYKMSSTDSLEKHLGKGIKEEKDMTIKEGYLGQDGKTHQSDYDDAGCFDKAAAKEHASRLKGKAVMNSDGDWHVRYTPDEVEESVKKNSKLMEATIAELSKKK